MTEQRPESRVMSIDQASLRRTLRTLTYWLAFLLVARWVLGQNGGFIFLLLLAWLLAIAMDPAIRWFTNRKLKRGIATGIVMLILVLLTAAFLGIFGGVLFSQATSLITSIPDIVTGVVDRINSVFKLNIDPNSVVDSLNISPSQIASWASGVAGGVLGIVSMMLGGIFQLLTILLFSFYLAAEGPRVRQVIGSWMSPNAQEVFVTTWDIAVQKTGGFVVSKVVLALASTTAHSIFFAVIGLPYWLAMGMITGIASQFIPTVGTLLGISVPLLFAVFDDPMMALWILVFAGIYQQIENYLLSPRISRMTMDIHPAIAFGSVLVFANMFGATGALISVPVAAALVAIVDTYGHRYELIPRLSQDPAAPNKG